MPYRKPPAKVRDLPRREQKKWVEIFNSAYKYARDKGWSEEKVEEYAHKVAWSKVKKNGRK